MKIGLIGDEFSSQAGEGIPRYGQEILAGLSRQGEDAEPVCVRPPRTPVEITINHAVRLPVRILRRANRFELLHAVMPIGALCFPFIRKPKVVTYHDLLSLLYPDSGQGLSARLFAPLFLRIAARWSDQIIAVSHQTARDLVTHLRVPENKITVVNEGISSEFRPMKREKRDFQVVGYLGSFIARKRVEYLIGSFYHLKKKYPALKVKLVVCGKKSYEYPRLAALVRKHGLTEDVEFKGFVAEGKLVEAYNSFDVFAFPSEWEGFGFPILEAQRCGIPVVIREEVHISPEVSKCCLKARSEQDMADKIYQLLTNPNLKQDIIEKGLKYSAQFTWERTVSQTLEVYERVMREK